jgi:hypothetical protein
MALFDPNDIDNIDNTNAIEAEEYSAEEEIHPAGTFDDAKITDIKPVTGYLIVEITTGVGSISKFYERKVVNGKKKVDPYMSYLIKAAGLNPAKFDPDNLKNKVVKITVEHYIKNDPDPYTGENVNGAKIVKIEKVQ